MIKGIRNKLVYFVTDAFKIKYRIVSADLQHETATVTPATSEGKIHITAKWNDLSYVEES